MKKFKIFAVVVLAFILVFGAIQFCIADPFDVDIEGEGNNVKLVFTINGKKYEVKLSPYTGDTENTNSVSAEGEITIEEAKSIALDDAGVTDVTFTKAKRDYDDGRAVYEIDFIYDNVEYEYEIAVADGSIVKKDIDYKRNVSITDNSGEYNITAEEAENIALNDAGVARSSVRYIKSKLDSDHGVTVYEVEFAVGNTEYEYDINAADGNIVSKDVDRD